MKIHVLYHWFLTHLNERLSGTFEKFSNNSGHSFSFYELSMYRVQDLYGVDVFIFSNLRDKKALEIADESRMRGIRIIYDIATGDDVQDVRAHNLRDMIMKTADKVTSADESVALHHKHIKDVLTVIRNGDHEKWSEVIASVSHPIQRHREDSWNHKKRIFFVAPTLMWPHQYIADVLVKNLMDMGHCVQLFTLKPTRFHRETICRFKDFDNDYVSRVLEYAEDIWKLPLLIDRDKPALVLTVQGYMIPGQILVEIGRRKVHSAVWFMDEPYDTSRSSSYGRYFTHVFLQDSSSVSYHRRHGNPESFYLPHGCDHAGVHPKGVGKEVFLNDVALVGTPFPARMSLVKRMLEANIKVAVVGKGWKRFADGLPAASKAMLSVNEGTISFSNATSFYRRSKININVHRSEDDFSTNPGTFRAVSPNCSMFYIPGSGGFQLADAGREETKDFFVPGKEIILFNSQDECVEMARHYLTHDDKRLGIAMAGYERVVREHTYSHRLDRMLKMIDESDGVRFNTGHRKSGYLNILGDIPHSTTHICEGSIHAVLVDRNSAIDISERIKQIRIDPLAGFASAINTAVLEMPSDFIIAGGMGLWQSNNSMEEILKLFYRDIYLGMVLFRDTKGGRITGFVMPVRVVMDSGSFRFGDVTKSILDIRYRLEDMGLVVQEVSLESQPVDGTPFSKELSEDEMEFLLEWTDDPESRIKAQRLLSVVLDNQGKMNVKDSKSIIRKAIQICPSFRNGRTQLGALLLKHGEFSEARLHLKTVWELERDNAQSALLYALSLFMSSDFEMAHLALDDVLSGDSTPSQKATAWYQKGLIHKKRNQLEYAHGAFTKALELDPSHFNSMQELALIYISMGENEHALQILRKKLHFTDDAPTMNDIGVISWQSGKKEEAYKWLIKALKKDPSNRDAVINVYSVGTDLGYQGKLKDSIITYLSLRPGDAEVAKLLQSMQR
ncbi:MAG: glycosyltransferase [Deltaproteobacteria bacterium]|nr:glycosyltransferase [Deltaproteobacteria bacterium]